MTRVLLWLLCALLIGIVTAADTNDGTDSETDSNVETRSYAESSSFAESKSSSSQSETSSVVECKKLDTTDVSDTTNEVSTTTTTEPCNSGLTCGSNEVVDNCPADCPSDRCPRSEAEAKAPRCLTPEVCSPPQCKCAFNYRRADNGTCIPTRSCPPFACSGVNEEFAACPPLCPTDDCSQASPSGECPRQIGNILIVLECSPTCRCKKGYWRKNGVCVPYAECNTTTCGKNEVLDKCPANCRSQYCPRSEEETNQSQQCTQPNPCPPPACKCRIDYRRAENGTCIPTRDCPPFKCRGVNEEYNSCPPFCPSDDCSQATPDGTCPKRFGRIGIRLICSPKCRCRKGFWRKNGICRPYADCNKECNAPNEEYVQEKRTCPPETCISLVAKFRCLNETTKSGCACKSGFLRVNETSPCVPICECPQMKNSLDCMKKPDNKECNAPNEEYVQEKRTCPPETCFSLVARFSCLNETTTKSGCFCKSGFLRVNETSPCVPICECPEMRNSLDCMKKPDNKECNAPNEEYVQEKRICPPETCFSLLAEFSCLNETTSGCFCKSGFLRVNETSPCVPICECPQMRNSPDCMKKPDNKECNAPNEEYVQEKRICPPETCFSLLAEFSCLNETTSGCFCKSGFLRVNETSPCVPICECPQMRNSPDCMKEPDNKLCPLPNEVYMQEKPSCPPQECFALVARINCTGATPPAPGCGCKPGFLRLDSNSSCMPQCQCPELMNTQECMEQTECQ